jgi:hypothetical protein
MDETETIAEWVTAHYNRAMLRVFKELFLVCTRINGPFKRSTEVTNVKIHVRWSPMPLVVALPLCMDGRLCACLLFEQANFEIISFPHDYSRGDSAAFVKPKALVQKRMPCSWLGTSTLTDIVIIGLSYCQAPD